MPRISIVTPTLNAARFIESCVESVRHAFAGLDYEHVVVDGVSTDGTMEYLEKQPDLKIFQGRDGGMYEALNRAVGETRGEVVGHLNADEQYNPQGVRHVLEKFQNPEVDAVLGPTIMVGPELEFMQILKQVVIPRPVDVDWHMPVQTCSFFFRRNLWERIPYPTRYRLAGDHAWVRQQMKSGVRFDAVMEPIGIFMWHGENLSCGNHPDEPDLLDRKKKKSLRILLAKNIYRGRKWLAGGYTRSPVEYEIFRSGKFEKIRIEKPVLRIRDFAYYRHKD
jgi:glycosyltransferase involved in cell wall biosynthesis